MAKTEKTAFIDRLHGAATWVREASFLQLAERGLAIVGLLALLSIPWNHHVIDDVSHHVMVGDYNKRMADAKTSTTTTSVPTTTVPTTTSTTLPVCPPPVACNSCCTPCFGPPQP